MLKRITGMALSLMLAALTVPGAVADGLAGPAPGPGISREYSAAAPGRNGMPGYARERIQDATQPPPPPFYGTPSRPSTWTWRAT